MNAKHLAVAVVLFALTSALADDADMRVTLPPASTNIMSADVTVMRAPADLKNAELQGFNWHTNSQQVQIVELYIRLINTKQNAQPIDLRIRLSQSPQESAPALSSSSTRPSSDAATLEIVKLKTKLELLEVQQAEDQYDLNACKKSLYQVENENFDLQRQLEAALKGQPEPHVQNIPIDQR